MGFYQVSELKRLCFSVCLHLIRANSVLLVSGFRFLGFCHGGRIFIRDS